MIIFYNFNNFIYDFITMYCKIICFTRKPNTSPKKYALKIKKVMAAIKHHKNVVIS